MGDDFKSIREGVKKTFFGGTSVPNMGGWGRGGADSQTFGDIEIMHN